MKKILLAGTLIILGLFMFVPVSQAGPVVWGVFPPPPPVTALVIGIGPIVFPLIPYAWGPPPAPPIRWVPPPPPPPPPRHWPGPPPPSRPWR